MCFDKSLVLFDTSLHSQVAKLVFDLSNSVHLRHLLLHTALVLESFMTDSAVEHLDITNINTKWPCLDSACFLEYDVLVQMEHATVFASPIP